MRRSLPSVSVLLLGPLVVLVATRWASGWAATDPRVPPPKKFDKELTEFFQPDAKQFLIGERPSFEPTATKAASGGTGSTGEPAASESGGGGGWAAIISPETLIDEIKSYQTPLTQAIGTPSDFKGGGYRKARQHFSMLAVCFGIIAQHEGDVRWKDQAEGARDLFARAGMNCKTGTDQSYAEGKLRADDLAAMMRGEKIEVKPAEGPVSWDKVANRPPLMSRLERAQQERLGPWTASAAEFKKNSAEIVKEAEIVAALAEVIAKDGFEYAEDEGYQEYCKAMKDSGLQIVEAVKSNDFESAKAAVSEMGQSCSSCHGDFRS